MSDILSAHVLTDEEAQRYLSIGVTAREIVRLGFPDADDYFTDLVLWEKTPFPLVRGIHDIADAVATLVLDGPRCDFPTGRAPNYACRRKVNRWGAGCYLHREPLIVKRADQPTGFGAA